MRLIRAIVESAECLVQRRQAAAVIAFEILMMQVVEVIAAVEIEVLGDLKLLKAAMAQRR